MDRSEVSEAVSMLDRRQLSTARSRGAADSSSRTVRGDLDRSHRDRTHHGMIVKNTDFIGFGLQAQRIEQWKIVVGG